MGELRNHTESPRPFSPEEHARLIQMVNDGMPIKDICVALGRKQSSVSGRLKNCDVHGNFISRKDRVTLAEMGVDDEILEMHRLGMSQANIGEALGFKSTAIGTRLRFLLGLSGEKSPINKARAMRPCTMCRKDFMSDGPHLRRCPRCQRALERSDVHYVEYSLSISM